MKNLDLLLLNIVMALAISLSACNGRQEEELTLCQMVKVVADQTVTQSSPSFVRSKGVAIKELVDVLPVFYNASNMRSNPDLATRIQQLENIDSSHYGWLFSIITYDK